MRILIIFAALVLPAAAQAGTYLLVCGPAACVAQDGTTQPAGTAFARILWDGVTPYTPPAGQEVVPDDGRPIFQPAPSGP